MAFDFNALAGGVIGPALTSFANPQAGFAQQQRFFERRDQQAMSGFAQQILSSPNPAQALRTRAGEIVGQPGGAEMLQTLMQLAQEQQGEFIKGEGGDIFYSDPKKPGELTQVVQGMPQALREMSAIVGGNQDLARQMLFAEHQTKTDLMKAQTQAALRGPQPSDAQMALRAKEALVPQLLAAGVPEQTVQLWLAGQFELRQISQTDAQGQQVVKNMLVPTVPGVDAIEIGGQPGLPQPDTSGLVQPSPAGAAPAVEGMSNPRYGPAEAVFGAGAAPMVSSTVGSVTRQAGAQGSDVGLAAKNRRQKIQQYQQRIMGLREAARVPAAEIDRMVGMVGGQSVLADPLALAENWIQLRSELEGRLRNAQQEAEGAQSPKTRENALESAQALRNFLAEFPTYTQLEAARDDIQSGAVDLSPGAAEEEIERGVNEAVNGGKGAPMVNTQEDFDKLPAGAEFTYRDDQGNVKRGKKN